MRFGKLMWRRDQNGQHTVFTNDAHGRLTRVQYPDGGETQHHYNDVMSPRFIRTEVKQRDGVYQYQWRYFDGLGRMIQTVQSDGPDDSGTPRYRVTKTHFDALGRPYYQTGPFFRYAYAYLSWNPGEYPIAGIPFVLSAYDRRDRPEIVQQPGDRQENAVTQYDYNGFRIDMTDPDGCRTSEHQDHLGRVIAKIEHSAAHGSQATRYSYNAAHDLIQVQNPLFDRLGPTLKSRQLIHYNTLGRKIELQDPDLGWWFFRYDRNGNLERQTDNAGNTIEYRYDQFNRMVRKIHPQDADPNIFYYQYDNPAAGANGIGRPHRVLAGPLSAIRVSRVFDRYDTVGRVLGKTVRIEGDSHNRSLQYSYDLTRILHEIL